MRDDTVVAQFYEIVAQVIALLKREKRVSYRALRRQFDLDDSYVEDLKFEMVRVKELAKDKDGEMLVWTGDHAMPAASGDTDSPPPSDGERLPAGPGTGSRMDTQDAEPAQ